MKLNSPFVISGYKGPEYFCDRVEETRKLCMMICNESNVTLLSPRRYGKTGLIKHVFDCLEKESGYETIYLDIFGTQNLTEFTTALAQAVIGRLDSPIEKLGGVAKRLIQMVRPTLSYDEFSGKPQFTISLDPDLVSGTLEQVFKYFKEHDARTVVALDEFQQIAEYPEKGTEALLRSRIQFLAGNRFIFSGSRQHMMAEMFVSAKRPFYHSTQLMHIGEIDKDEYYAFAAGHFKAAGIELPQDVFNSVYERFSGITWYVQAVMNRLYETRMQTVTGEDVKSAIEWLVAAGAYEFQGILQSCSDGAVRLLKALGKEGVVNEPNSGEFIARHSFKSASSVNAALKSLRDADLVDRTDAGYLVYDRLFALWLSRLP